MIVIDELRMLWKAADMAFLKVGYFKISVRAVVLIAEILSRGLPNMKVC
jgi:hypothetical protein